MMRILYHHRTRSTDAQRVHILEMVAAFRALGHQVTIVSLVNTEAPADAGREVSEASWKRWIRRIPYGYEAAQLAYNLLGLPMLLARLWSGHYDLLY